MSVCKHIILFTTIILTTACKQKTASPTSNAGAESPDTTNASAISAEQLINAGQSIGQIKLNGNADDVIKLLGRPDRTDAAMGSAMDTWYANHDTAGYRTSIFTQRNMGGADEAVQRIKKILVTSPWFKTADYISTGNNMQDIVKFHTLKEGNTYYAKGKKITTYSDVSKGISFDIDDQGKCVGVLVYQPDAAADAYLNMH